MEEIDLKELFIVFWNKRFLIILITLISIAVGVVYSYFFTVPEYKSVAKIVLVQAMTETTQNFDGTITQADLTLNSNLVSTYSEIIKSKSILREVVNSLNNKNLNESNLKRNISVQAVKDTEVIEITVKNLDSTLAAEIANKITEIFSQKVVEIYNISNVYILDKAEPNSTPSNINHKKDMVIFAFIGLVISAAIVLLLNIFDTTIKTEKDIESIMGTPILSTIPNYGVETSRKNKRGGRRA